MVDYYDDGAEQSADWRFERRRARSSEPRSSEPRSSEPRLEQRLDQWVNAGRQLVDGVSGARPGSRSGARGAGMRFDHLGRWVEDKLDWLLDDDEAWPETWEASAPARPRPEERMVRSRREPLQAISRRGRSLASVPAAAPVASPMPADPQDWPDDDNFTLNRWRRGDEPRMAADVSDRSAAPPLQSGRTVPRSSRRRIT